MCHLSLIFSGQFTCTALVCLSQSLTCTGKCVFVQFILQSEELDSLSDCVSKISQLFGCFVLGTLVGAVTADYYCLL